MIAREQPTVNVWLPILMAIVAIAALLAVACERVALGQGPASEAKSYASPASSPMVSRKEPSQSPGQKIDSSLLQAQEQRSAPVQTGTPVSAVHLDSSGRVLVDIKAEITERLVSRISELGGSVVSSFPQYRQVRAALPLSELQNLASLPEVSFIRPAETPLHNAPLTGAPGKTGSGN